MFSNISKFFKKRYINNLDVDSQIDLIVKKEYTLDLIDNPDKRLLFEAVKADPFNIKYIKKPDRDLQLLAVNNDGAFAFECIDNPILEVQLIAVKKNPWLFNSIKKPDIKIQIEALSRQPYILNSTNFVFKPIVLWFLGCSCPDMGGDILDYIKTKKYNIVPLNDSPHTFSFFQIACIEMRFMRHYRYHPDTINYCYYYKYNKKFLEEVENYSIIRKIIL